MYGIPLKRKKHLNFILKLWKLAESGGVFFHIPQQEGGKKCFQDQGYCIGYKKGRKFGTPEGTISGISRIEKDKEAQEFKEAAGNK